LIINKSLAASSWSYLHLLIEDARSSEHKRKIVILVIELIVTSLKMVTVIVYRWSCLKIKLFLLQIYAG
jgi:hypothetical protein